MGRNVALIVAAGSGSRAGGETPKQYRKIAGKTLIAHAIDHLAHPRIDAVQVVIGEGQEAAYAEAIGDRALPAPVIGGATRRESVANGLAALRDADAVLIHDAARPFLPGAVIDRLLDALASLDGAVPALPVVDTLTTRAGDQVRPRCRLGRGRSRA
jgi:2-C-methyl-D-erythritol 4-phosphate cytidylyltransferase / 2-C-methyl-D-erythritol 2,4-cyclodiphosphate synthase